MTLTPEQIEEYRAVIRNYRLGLVGADALLTAAQALLRENAELRKALERLVAAHGEGGRWHADRYAFEQKEAVQQAREALGRSA